MTSRESGNRTRFEAKRVLKYLWRYTSKNNIYQKANSLLMAVLMCAILLIPMASVNVYASTTQYESTSNYQTTPDTIQMGYVSGEEHHMLGTISTSTDSDWYEFKPLRHGRVFVMVLCGGIFYNVDLYKSSTTSTPIYQNTYTTYDCIADASFVVKRNTVDNNNMPTYYINVSSYNNNYNTSKNYRIIIFYALYGTWNDSRYQYPLTLSGSANDNNLRITSSVGYRTYDYTYHIGTDIGASYKNDIFCISDATVYKSEDHAEYGNRVFLILDVSDPYSLENKINVRYYHLDSINQNVQTGVELSKGDTIGKVGYDGLPSIYHTHLHIDINSMPASSGGYRFLQSVHEENPEYIINIVDVFTDLSYWANNSGYIYINS